MLTQVEIKEVYKMLKTREVNPSGSFDNAGRFWLANADLVSVRTPSRAYPYSQMQAGRTLKYVKAVAAEFNCKSKAELLKFI